MSLESLISTFGAPAIFAGCALEGETVAFFGGVVAHRGLVVLASLAGPLPLGLLLGLAVAAVAATALLHLWRKRASAFGQPGDKR